MKAVVAAFNQEKALVGAFSVITNLRMELFEALLNSQWWSAVLIQERQITVVMKNIYIPNTDKSITTQR